MVIVSEHPGGFRKWVFPARHEHPVPRAWRQPGHDPQLKWKPPRLLPKIFEGHLQAQNTLECLKNPQAILLMLFQNNRPMQRVLTQQDLKEFWHEGFQNVLFQ